MITIIDIVEEERKSLNRRLELAEQALKDIFEDYHCAESTAEIESYRKEIAEMDSYMMKLEKQIQQQKDEDSKRENRAYEALDRIHNNY